MRKSQQFFAARRVWFWVPSSCVVRSAGRAAAEGRIGPKVVHFRAAYVVFHTGLFWRAKGRANGRVNGRVRGR
eukprot:6301888-Lingulodinium_polyedra.AAC.1